MFENQHTEQSGLVTERDRSSAHCSPRKGFAYFMAICSLFAVIAVPYLVLKSVYYLSNDDDSASFKQMIDSGNAGFWVFGPIVSILAFLAISPFNFYNTYKSVNDGKNPFHSLKSFIINLMRIAFISSGSVNGFFTNMAYRDVVGTDSSLRQFFQVLLVFNAVLFAGLADSRIVINYTSNELRRDFRYGIRAIKNVSYRLGFFKLENETAITKKVLIYRVRRKLDDFYYTTMLGFDDTQVNHGKRFLSNQEWLNHAESQEMGEYINHCKNQFPMKRYIFSEIIGGGFSACLAYFGNKNVLKFAFNAIVDFFEYCGANTHSFGVQAFAAIFSFVGYAVGILVSFFLIRDLFFRDIFKNNSFSNFGSTFIKKFFTLIPALSFGSLNVILTIMNDSLSPVSKIIVALSAIIGATVVSRYGIEGGLKEFAGKRNFRREAAALSQSLSGKLDSMSIEHLSELSQQLGCFPEDQIPLSVISDHQELDELKNDSTGFSY